jgi:hypothetical protein
MMNKYENGDISWFYDLTDPPGNPEFDLYDRQFREMVAARFERGIALGKANDRAALRKLVQVSRSKESFGW